MVTRKSNDWGATLQWINIPSSGTRNTLSCLKLWKKEISLHRLDGSLSLNTDLLLGLRSITLHCMGYPTSMQWHLPITLQWITVSTGVLNHLFNFIFFKNGCCSNLKHVMDWL